MPVIDSQTCFRVCLVIALLLRCMHPQMGSIQVHPLKSIIHPKTGSKRVHPLKGIIHPKTSRQNQLNTNRWFSPRVNRWNYPITSYELSTKDVCQNHLFPWEIWHSAAFLHKSNPIFCIQNCNPLALRHHHYFSMDSGLKIGGRLQPRQMAFCT